MRPLVDWYLFHIVETHISEEAATEPPPAFLVRILDLQDGVEHVDSELREISVFQPVDVERRLRLGDAVAIATVDGKAVGCSWVMFTSRLTAPTDLIWILRKDEAVTYGSFVLPDWRGRRVHRSLDAAITKFLRARGVSHNYGSMSALNPQTLSLLRQTDKRIVTTVLFVHLKGLNWNFRYSTQEPLDGRFRIAAPLRQRIRLVTAK